MIPKGADNSLQNHADASFANISISFAEGGKLMSRYPNAVFQRHTLLFALR